MTRDTEHTPSPQSVVVPVELAETPAIRNTLGLLRSAILCGEQWSDTCRDAYLAALKELDQLAAAPAPSSLAGGEVPALRAAYDRWVHEDAEAVEVIERVGVFLAALSPEAPAREGVAELIDQLRQSEGAAVTIMCDNPDFNGQPNSAVEVVADWTNWQTVRFTGDTVADALRNARNMVGGKIMGEALTPRHEAPAEGAGDAWIVHDGKENPAPGQRVDVKMTFTTFNDIDADTFDWNGRCHWRRSATALRARSSAPEAREGEAVAWRYRPSSAATAPFPPPSVWNYHEDNPSDSLASYYEVQPLYAAPSADKLRIATEALLTLPELKRRQEYLRKGIGTATDEGKIVLQALAALKSEVTA